MKTCTVEGCTVPVVMQGVCRSHYSKLRRIGALHVLPKPTVAERFFTKFERSDSGCWRWLAPRPDGYGQFKLGKRMVKAHRVSYELFVGPIPEGLHIDHLCCNRACVNPAHLEAVTQGENTRRACKRDACFREHDVTDYYFDSTGKRICRACERLNYYKRKARRLAA